jgi:hypothetical protein
MINANLNFHSFAVIIVVMWYFFHGTISQATSGAEALAIPIGTVDMQTLITSNGQIQRGTEPGFFSVVLLANLPQLGLSAIYASFNRVVTTFALCIEMNQFSLRQRGLRVSTVPQGVQRSAYFLQLPYRFALPVMLLSGILHWLCSQSIFLVSILEQSPILDPATNSTIIYETAENLTWGFSPQAMLILVLLIMLMYAALLGFSARSLASRMPVSGSCSAVISAMCHPPADEDGEEAVLKPLKWGVSTEEVHAGGSVVEYSFSSRTLRQHTEDDMVRMLAYTGRACNEWTM